MTDNQRRHRPPVKRATATSKKVTGSTDAATATADEIREIARLVFEKIKAARERATKTSD